MIRLQDIWSACSEEANALMSEGVIWESLRCPIPRLRAVRPHAMVMRLNPLASFNKAHQSFQLTQQLR